MLACAGIIVAALALIWGDAAAASPSGVLCEVFTIHSDNFSQDCATRIYRVPYTQILPIMSHRVTNDRNAIQPSRTPYPLASPHALQYKHTFAVTVCIVVLVQ